MISGWHRIALTGDFNWYSGAPEGINARPPSVPLHSHAPAARARRRPISPVAVDLHGHHLTQPASTSTWTPKWPPHLDRFSGKRPATFRTRIRSRKFFPRGYPERSRGDLPASVASEPARTGISCSCGSSADVQPANNLHCALCGRNTRSRTSGSLPGSFWAGRLLERSLPLEMGCGSTNDATGSDSGVCCPDRRSLAIRCSAAGRFSKRDIDYRGFVDRSSTRKDVVQNPG